MSKIVCYTAIVGKYDQLHDPLTITPNVDYICFTDQKFDVNVWQCKPIPTELHYLSNVKTQRILKICPYKWLEKYDLSIWVDGNIDVIGDLNAFVQQYDLNKSPIYTRIHPSRNCIYDEAEACIQMRKDIFEVVNNQVRRYELEGYPKHIGMVETGILLRKHNDLKCKLLSNLWATELLLNSHRDQLSFNYACWKLHILPGYLTHEFKSYDNKFFNWHAHG